MQSHKQHARRRARTAQLAVGVGLAGALAVAVLPLHAALTRRAQPAGPTEPQGTEPVETATREPLDQAWASRIFVAVGPEALPAADSTLADPVVPAEPLPEPAGPKDGDNLPANPRWQYLGSILTSRGRSALLRDTQMGKQHLVSEGKEVEGFTVRRVTATHVILADSNEQTKVDLAPLSSSWTPPPGAASVKTATAPPAAVQPRNSRVNPSLASRARAERAKGEIDSKVVRQVRDQLLSGEMDLDRLSAMQKAGMIDEATAEELVVQYKESQNLTEEQYMQLREKLKQ